MSRRRAVVAALVGLAAVLLLGGAWLALKSPRSDRDWAVDHATPARVAFHGDRVEIRNVRDFRHHPDGAYEERYLEMDLGLDEVRGVALVVAPFADRWRGLAHTFLTFELRGPRWLAVSVEARREADESYSLVGGLLRRFEVTYVIGTEEDLIGLRALRGDSLYLYPAAATPQQASALLADVLRRAESLRLDPEFYHTLTNNCTTNLRDHVNRLTPGRLPWGWGVLLPGYADALALEHGLLATDLPIEKAREAFRVDARARRALSEGRPLSPALRSPAG